MSAEIGCTELSVADESLGLLELRSVVSSVTSELECLIWHASSLEDDECDDDLETVLGSSWDTSKDVLEGSGDSSLVKSEDSLFSSEVVKSEDSLFSSEVVKSEDSLCNSDGDSLVNSGDCLVNSGDSFFSSGDSLAGSGDPVTATGSVSLIGDSLV